MHKIFIYALFLLITGGGTFIANRFQLRKERRHHQRTLALVRDSLQASHDTTTQLRANIRYLVSADSLKATLIAQHQGIFLDLSRHIRRLKTDSTALATDLQDSKSLISAMADGVVTDSVTVIKKFLRKPKITRIRK